MLTYNTQLKDIKVPEYGRNIQNMVDYAVNIEDREQRNAAAHAIVRIMSTLFPAQNKNDEDAQRRYWDHIAIMSNFKLDIDWPFEVITEESLQPNPDPVPYDTGIIGLRQYGRNIETMISMIAEMEEGRDRHELITMIANQMKKNLLAENKDDDPDDKILNDIYEMSKGRIRLKPGDIALHEYNVVAPPSKKKKKK